MAKRKRWLSSAEAAKVLGVGRDHVSSLYLTGKIKGTKGGHKTSPLSLDRVSVEAYSLLTKAARRGAAAAVAVARAGRSTVRRDEAGKHPWHYAVVDMRTNVVLASADSIATLSGAGTKSDILFILEGMKRGIFSLDEAVTRIRTMCTQSN